MGTHTREHNESDLMNTNMAGLDKCSLSIGRVNSFASRAKLVRQL